MMYQIDKTEFTIEGKSRTETNDQNRIWVDGVELLPDASQKIRNHSPDGHNWGYSGSGPAQTALAICLHIVGHERLAQVLYQGFKRSFVATWQPAGADFKTQIDITDLLIENCDLIKREEEYQMALQELSNENYQDE